MDEPLPTSILDSFAADNNVPPRQASLVIPFLVFISGLLLFGIILILRLRSTRRRHQPAPRDDQNLASFNMLPVLAVSPYTVTERRKLGKYLSTAPMPAMFDTIVDRPLGTIEKNNPLGWDNLQPVNVEKPPALQASMIQSPSEMNVSEVLSLAFVVRMPTPKIHPPGLACQHTIMLGTGISTVAIAHQRADLKVSS